MEAISFFVNEIYGPILLGLCLFPIIVVLWCVAIAVLKDAMGGDEDWWKFWK